MNKKFLLSFAALFGIFTGAMADDYGLKICGVEVTDENKGDLIAIVNAKKAGDDPIATGTMTYNSETKTLSLNDVSIDVGMYSSVGNLIESTSTLTIEQTGTNVIETSFWAHNIIVFGANLTIKGDGVLTLTTGDAYHIYNKTEYNSLNIDHTTLVCNSSKESCVSLWGNLVNLVINESTVKSAGGISYCNSITLTNARISEPTGAYLKEHWAEIYDSDGELAKNVVIVPDTRKEAVLAWSEAITDFRFGSSFIAPKLTNESGVAVTYESSHPEFASIDATTGDLTIIKPSIVDYSTANIDGYGNYLEIVRIKAMFAGNSEYKPLIVSYGLIISKGEPILYVPSTVTATLGETFESPVVTVKNGLDEILDLAVTYSSSDENVATVDAVTGAITVKGIGETTISFVSAKNDYYHEGKGSYTLTVSASTGIGQVNATTESAEVFDLLGRRVQGVTNRGLYIVNGHKVICK